MNIDNIEEFIQIDKRIDSAEEQVGDLQRESLRDRWEFGKLMLAKRVGKQLPKRYLEELGLATGKGRSELQYRMQFAERYPTEDEVSMAMDTLRSWRQVKLSLPKPRPDVIVDERAMPRSDPWRHPKHDDVVELSGQGKTRPQIAEEVGISEESVRRSLEREYIEQKAREEATVVDWATVTGKAKDREAILRRTIRRELEAEFEPRVQAEVRRRVAAVTDQAEQMHNAARRVLDTRDGVITRSEYDLIRSCLHPDSRLSATNEKLAKAFRVFNEAEILLLNEKDCPTTVPKSPPIPAWEDLQKRKRK